MMSLQQAVMAAMSTPSGTTEYHVACELARVRGFDPNSFARMDAIPPMQHWQRIIAETLLEQSLRDAMLAPAR